MNIKDFFVDEKPHMFAVIYIYIYIYISDLCDCC